MPETIYLYTGKHSGGTPYLATLRELEANLPLAAALAGRDPPELEERTWAVDKPPVVVDQDEDIIAEAATLETLERLKGTQRGALWWEVVAREGWGLIKAKLDKRATFGQQRRALATYEALIEE